MADYDPLRDGCGAHGCVIKKPTGQGTNGGCMCKPSVLRAKVRELRKERNTARKSEDAQMETLQKLQTFGVEIWNFVQHDAECPWHESGILKRPIGTIGAGCICGLWDVVTENGG